MFSCGFDSIPFDLGVLSLQDEGEETFRQAVRAREGTRAQDARHVLRGTAASLKATLAAAARGSERAGAAEGPVRADAGLCRAEAAERHEAGI